MAEPHLLYDVSEGIATITLNRPDARNALSPEMRGLFVDALADIKARAGEDIRAMILTGAGGAFCAGGDIKSMGERTAASGRSGLRDGHVLMYELTNLEMPTVALVDGAAAGAGANIALSCDFVMATPRGLFLQAFGRIGLVPDYGGFFLLPRLVGLQKAKELVFTARRVGADEAVEMGLIHAKVGQETAMAEARAFAGRFRDAPTTAIGVAKNILNQSFNLDHRAIVEMEAVGQGICQSSEYHKEAVRRFRDKEPAMFDWEAIEREAAAATRAAAE